MNEKISAGPARVANHRAVGRDLPRRRGADRAEDAGADHRADRQHDQIAGAEHALQRPRRSRASSTTRSAIGLRWKSWLIRARHSTSCAQPRRRDKSAVDLAFPRPQDRERRHQLGEFAVTQQECRVAGMAALRLSRREGLVEDPAAGLQGVAQHRHQRPMQVVEHQHHVECRGWKIGRRIGFEIDDRGVDLEVRADSAVARRNASASALRSIARTSNPALAISNA